MTDVSAKTSCSCAGGRRDSKTRSLERRSMQQLRFALSSLSIRSL